MTKEPDYSFGTYLTELREYKNISQEQLSDGLCDTGMLSRFERGEREPDRLLQERLMTRLGVQVENHTNYLCYEDYLHAKKREEIMLALMKVKPETGALLEDYKENYLQEHFLDEQFYLVMLAQYVRQQGCEEAELEKLFQRAILLTVPDAAERDLPKCVLSMEEIYILIEFLRYSPKYRSLERYEQVIEYIEKSQETSLAMVKLYPQVVYYYFLEWQQNGEKSDRMVQRVWDFCKRGIQLLRENDRMFFLDEILMVCQTMIEVYGVKPDEASDGFAEQQLYNWRDGVRKLYEYCGISPQMKECCHVFVGAENYCLGDVIRVRREMLKISKTTLSAGICTPRTIARLERNETNTHSSIVKQILLRLNLSPTAYSVEVATNSHSERELYWKVATAINSQDKNIVRIGIERLKKKLDMDVVINKRTVEYMESVYHRYMDEQGATDIKGHAERLRKCLSYTLDNPNAFENSELYFDNFEMICIRNLSGILEGSEKQLYREAIEKNYASGRYTNYLRQMEYMQGWIASKLGNDGEYNKSDQMTKELMWMGLFYRHSFVVHRNVYGLEWNDRQRMKNKTALYSLEEHKEMLRICILLSEFEELTHREVEYRKVLDEMS